MGADAAALMLEAILVDLASRNVLATPLNVIGAATDLGADDDLAAGVAELFQQQEEEDGCRQ